MTVKREGNPWDLLREELVDWDVKDNKKLYQDHISQLIELQKNTAFTFLAVNSLNGHGISVGNM